MISADLIGCSTARNKGTCDNRRNIRRDRLEERVLDALRHHLMDPTLFKEFCDEFTREMNRLRMNGRASIDAAQIEVKRIERELEKIMQLFLNDAMPIDVVKERSSKLERRRIELHRFLSDAAEPPPLLHPEMATFYRLQVAELYDALREESEAKRMKAAEIIRSLVKEIVLTPEGDELQIDVRGDLAGILGVSLKTKKPAKEAGRSQVEMVAGTGFEPVTFRL